MSSHLIAFLLGFVTCAVGVFIALIFDIGMGKLESLFAKYKSGE